MSTSSALVQRRDVLTRRVRLLTASTIGYNVFEAVIAVAAGVVASSSALIGFGSDSVIEVASAAGVAWQFSARDHEVRESREAIALRITAISFFALALYRTAGFTTSVGAAPFIPALQPGPLTAATGFSVIGLNHFRPPRGVYGCLPWTLCSGDGDMRSLR